MSLRYVPAWWLRNPHAHTLWGKLVRRPPVIGTKIIRLETPDGDFVDLVRVVGGTDRSTDGTDGRPRLIVLHGLEGSDRSHYARGLLAEAARRGWGADLLIFRGCGPEPNRARRFYHSGETSDLQFVVDHLRRECPRSPLLFVGVSLGGNVLLKWLGERGAGVDPMVAAAAAVSVPYDLERGARHINRGFARVYERHFLRSLRRKALEKIVRYPDLVPSAEAIRRATSIYEFDDALTAPVHGFRDAADYYGRSSSIRFLARIRIPTLLLSAEDDPFLPSEVLREVADIAHDNSCLDLEFVPRGGHVGFVGGRNPLRPFYYAEWRVASYLAARLAERFSVV